MIKFQQCQALTSHFESFWSIVWKGDFRWTLPIFQRQNAKPSAQEIEALNKEFAKDARAKMFWIYRTRDMKELKV